MIISESLVYFQYVVNRKQSCAPPFGPSGAFWSEHSIDFSIKRRKNGLCRPFGRGWSALKFLNLSYFAPPPHLMLAVSRALNQTFNLSSVRNVHSLRYHSLALLVAVSTMFPNITCVCERAHLGWLTYEYMCRQLLNYSSIRVCFVFSRPKLTRQFIECSFYCCTHFRILKTMTFEKKKRDSNWFRFPFFRGNKCSHLIKKSKFAQKFIARWRRTAANEIRKIFYFAAALNKQQTELFSFECVDFVFLFSIIFCFFFFSMPCLLLSVRWRNSVRLIGCLVVSYFILPIVRFPCLLLSAPLSFSLDRCEAPKRKALCRNSSKEPITKTRAPNSKVNTLKIKYSKVRDARFDGNEEESAFGIINSALRFGWNQLNRKSHRQSRINWPKMK